MYQLFEKILDELYEESDKGCIEGWVDLGTVKKVFGKYTGEVVIFLMGNLSEGFVDNQSYDGYNTAMIDTESDEGWMMEVKYS